MAPLTRYVACSRVAKRNIFEFVSTTIRPNDALMVFALDDYYSFGVLHSAAHWQWWQAKGSTLKDDARYTTDSVWDTFPWPQQPTRAQVRAVAAAARHLHEQRTKLLADYRLSLRELYRTLEQPGNNPLRDLHEALDQAVAAAYGLPAGQPWLPHLLALNQAVAAAEQAGQPTTGPGLPPGSAPADAVTDLCVRVLTA